MIKKGIGASKGYAVGTALVIRPQEVLSFHTAANDPAKEAGRLKEAIRKAKAQVREIARKADKSLNEKDAEIIESHLKFLDDPSFMGEAFASIEKQAITAEKAVSDITESLFALFSDFDDEYTKERAADIRDVGERVLRNLMGAEEEINFSAIPENTILVAHDLKPSETAQLDRKKVVGLVTEIGGQTSHTAILAKALGIAAVVGCGEIMQEIKTGDVIIVDGVKGEVLLAPDNETVLNYRSLAEECRAQKKQLTNLGEISTKEGKRLLVAANIGSLEDLKISVENGADGVGLFRTEFLYMEKTDTPTEEEQFAVYREAAELLGGKPLTIRTLDIGGDKNLPYLKMQQESNPFLGLRAIRLCLKSPELFHTQLRAILRASAYGNIQIMFPMISCLEELRQAKKHLNLCMEELERKSISYDQKIKVGMMIEIPSAAVTAEDFAKEVDFFSIGTNDLTQYTLAADRLNESVSGIYNPMHPAVLRLIHMTIQSAHKAHIPCYMCGELASDENAIPLLLQYGLDEFSVSPGVLSETKRNLLKIIGI